MPIRICIGNYGHYVAGKLRDTWLELPQTTNDIEHFLAEHGLKDPLNEETYISCYDGPILGVEPGHGGPFCETTPLEELNLLAAMIDELPEEAERLEDALNSGCDCPKTILGLANWLYAADELPYVPYSYDGCQNTDESGRSCIERLSATENMGRTVMDGTRLQSLLEKTCLEMYFDYEALGRDEEMSGYVSLGDYGYVDNSMAFPAEDAHSASQLEEALGLDL